MSEEGVSSGQPHALPHSSFYPFPLFAFPSAGSVDKIVLPEGMQEVNFYGCNRLSGTAKLGESEVHIYLMRFGGQSARSPHSSFSHFLFSFSAGDIGQLNLPEGMQEVNFSMCHRLTGTAEFG
jgi:hypothetical protein